MSQEIYRSAYTTITLETIDVETLIAANCTTATRRYITYKNGRATDNHFGTPDGRFSLSVALHDDTARYMADAQTVEEFTSALENFLSETKNGLVDIDHFHGANEEAWLTIDVTALENGSYEIVISKEDDEVEEMELDLKNSDSLAIISSAIRKHW